MLRVPVSRKPLKLKGAIIGSGSGPQERILQLQYWVTNLMRYERIEGREDRMQETRLYAEQLINLAVHRGASDHYTMKMAKHWLKSADLVHKLFKVIVPRYENHSTAFTSIYRLPAQYPGHGRFAAVLELKDNPYPPVIARHQEKAGLLHNVLLEAARNEFYEKQSSQKKDSNTVTKTDSEKDISSDKETVTSFSKETEV